VNANPGQELAAMTAARQASEERLGPAARGLTDRLSKLLSEALSLSRDAFSNS
jgi:hypothetical protein